MSDIMGIANESYSTSANTHSEQMKIPTPEESAEINRWYGEIQKQHNHDLSQMDAIRKTHSIPNARKINILGTEYTVYIKSDKEEPCFTKNKLDGYCDSISKEIAIRDLNKLIVGKMNRRKQKTLA
jgi:uncharacterized protein YacL (UPF0231 family)